MKKKLLIFTLIAFIVFNLQPKTANGFLEFLGAISGILGALTGEGEGGDNEEALQKIEQAIKDTNVNLSSLLETQFKDQITKTLSQISSKEDFEEFKKNIHRLVELRQKKVQTDLPERLRKARIVGAYQALEELPFRIQCIDNEYRDALLENLSYLMIEYDLVNKAQEIVNQIPECYTYVQYEENPEEISSKQKINIFSWLTEPFKFSNIKVNLAQIADNTNSDNNQEEGITIEPAVFQSIGQFRSYNQINYVQNFITETVQKSEEKTIKYIGDTWPLETCSGEYIYTDSGEPICSNYKVIVSGEVLKSLKNKIDEIDINKIQNQNLDIANVNLKSSTPQQTLDEQANLNTSEIKEATNQKLEDLNSEQNTGEQNTGEQNTGEQNQESEIEKILKKRCGNPPDENSSIEIKKNYVICVRQVVEIFRTYIDKEISKLQAIRNRIEATKKLAANIVISVEILKQTPAALENCWGAQRKVDKIELKGELLKDFFDPVYKWLNDVTTDILSKTKEFRNILADFDDKMSCTLNTLATAFEIGGRLLNIGKAIGKKLGIGWLVDFLSPIAKGFFDISHQLRETSEILDQTIGLVADLSSLIDYSILSFKKTIEGINKYHFTEADLINSEYEADELVGEVIAIRRLETTNTCKSKKQQGISLLNKNRVFVVKSQPNIVEVQKTNNFNLAVFFQNLWQPKLVEIRNEK